ncbi:MAG: hypothetical protein ACUVQP_09665, partial [Bacteroidales bacterium]
MERNLFQRIFAEIVEDYASFRESNPDADVVVWLRDAIKRHIEQDPQKAEEIAKEILEGISDFRSRLDKPKDVQLKEDAINELAEALIEDSLPAKQLYEESPKSKFQRIFDEIGEDYASFRESNPDADVAVWLIDAIKRHIEQDPQKAEEIA